jgi:hypothetical protein
MKNMKKLMVLMLMMASVFFIACNNDDDGKDPLSTEQAKEVINSLPTDISTQMSGMLDAEGLKVMEILMNTPYPFDESTKAAKESSVIFNINKYLIPNNYLKNQVSTAKTTEPGFDFNTYKGTYTYHNAPFEYWEIVPGGDKIILNFPSDENNMGVNDATLTLNNYAETLITEVDGQYTYSWYNPTTIDADLVVDAVKLVDVNISAEWIATGENAGEPTALDAIVYLFPFEFTGEFDHTGATAGIDFKIKFDGDIIFGVGLDATFETVEMDEPVNISGYVQFMDVKVKADADVKAIMGIMEGLYSETPVYTDPQQLVDALNTEFTATISVDGAKAADIEIAVNPAATTAEDFPFDVVFVFDDGTTQSAIPTFILLLDEMDEFFYFLDDFYKK